MRCLYFGGGVDSGKHPSKVTKIKLIICRGLLFLKHFSVVILVYIRENDFGRQCLTAGPYIRYLNDGVNRGTTCVN